LREATDITNARLYYYLAGKEEILVFLWRDLLAQIGDAAAIAADSDGTARDKLSAVVRAQLDVMAERTSMWRALVADLGRAGRMPEIAGAPGTGCHRPAQRSRA